MTLMFYSSIRILLVALYDQIENEMHIGVVNPDNNELRRDGVLEPHFSPLR